MHSFDFSVVVEDSQAATDLKQKKGLGLRRSRGVRSSHKPKKVKQDGSTYMILPPSLVRQHQSKVVH